ncbi:transporter [bacterium]|nr:MAG: transporter [bacterium]
MVNIWTAFLLLGLAAVPAFAQEKAKPTEPIATDRPDFTESALVVPYRWLQIESGLTYATGRRYRSLGGPETLLRYGIRRKTEIRAALPDYNDVRVRGRTMRGFGDAYLGAKFELGPLWGGTDLSLIPAVFLPSGSREFSSGAIDPEVKLCLSRELGGPWSLSAMEYIAFPTIDGRHVTTFQQTVSLGRDLGRGFAVFAEYAGTFSHEATANHLFHTGVTYRPSRDSQFDVHGGNSFVAAGYSVRF